jgi:hypothetical protein
MTRSLRRLALGALGLAAPVLSAPAGAAENLLKNGSFEDKKVDTDPGYHRGPPAPPGWKRVTGADLPDVISNDYVDFYATAGDGFKTYLKAQDGNQFLDTNGAGLDGLLVQDVFNLTTGAAVELSFWVGPWAQNTDGQLFVTMRDVFAKQDLASKTIKYEYTPAATSGEWTKYTISGTVLNNAELTVTIYGLSTGPARAALAIDNLTLIQLPVPEPASWAMMIGGFAVVGGAMRRRGAKVAFAG